MSKSSRRRMRKESGLQGFMRWSMKEHRRREQELDLPMGKVRRAPLDGLEILVEGEEKYRPLTDDEHQRLNAILSDPQALHLAAKDKEQSDGGSGHGGIGEHEVRPAPEGEVDPTGGALGGTGDGESGGVGDTQLPTMEVPSGG